MTTVVLAIHLMIAVALVGVILLQKSEGGALGMGGGGMSGFMTGRSTANLLTRTTAILAAAFFATSIALAVMGGGRHAPTSLIDQSLPTTTQPAKPAAPAPGPAEKPAQNSAPAPAAPSATAAPLAK